MPRTDASSARLRLALGLAERGLPVLATVEDAEDVDHELTGRLIHFISNEGPLLEAGRPHARSYVVARCGHLTLDEPPGSYAICAVCFWEDDAVQIRWPTMAGGANRPSLIDAQAACGLIAAGCDVVTVQRAIGALVGHDDAEHLRAPMADG